MQIGPLDITLHRTVRVADGRTPSNLPPSLGQATVAKVSDFREHCPAGWAEDGYFVALHEMEALWISFNSGRRLSPQPLAVIIGAGGINAVSGEKLGTKLSSGGYVVTPPQPWLDGWKGEDGNVYQFVATKYEGGDGLSVGEQILGAESVTGAIGIAVFEPLAPLVTEHAPSEGYSSGAYDSGFTYASLDCAPASKGLMRSASAGARGMSLGRPAQEMGVGKGGRITQKIYPDPYGIEAWKPEPTAVTAIYLVSAEDYAAITGVEIPKPVSSDTYGGKWFGLKDEGKADVAPSAAFSGLKAVFPASEGE